MVYAASIRSRRPCPLGEQRHQEARARVSVLLHPLAVGPTPLRLREIGAAENIDVPVSISCEINELR